MTRRRTKAKPKLNWIAIASIAGVVGVVVLTLVLVFMPRQQVDTQVIIQEKQTLTEKVGEAAIEIGKDQLIKELDERREERNNEQ